MKINNFSAGPSKIPREILNELSQDILDYDELGFSILEVSHRSDVFEDMLNRTKENLYKILNIPKNFEIILIQGGATFQNSFIPANSPQLLNNLIFLLTGSWGNKTHKDFQRYFNNKIPSLELNGQTFEKIIEEINKQNFKYLYLTSNETIEGIQIRDFSKFKNKKLIIDMSSDICSYTFDWDNISYVYAGAQKNLGIPGVTICIFEKEFFLKNKLTSYMDINNHIEKNSAFNTPPIFSIYVMLKVLEWIEKNGGIKKIEQNNKTRANKIYNFLDQNLNTLTPLAPIELRSNSNIVFDFKDKNQTNLFLEQCHQDNFIGLGGHRSVGGVRISNYNSITEKMVSDLLIFLEKFISGHQEF
tara:strand:- start:1692 stop:2768 length:1077 start_codon:yes stop_codon:yes gene_type:complete